MKWIIVLNWRDNDDTAINVATLIPAIGVLFFSVLNRMARFLYMREMEGREKSFAIILIVGGTRNFIVGQQKKKKNLYLNRYICYSVALGGGIYEKYFIAMEHQIDC